MGVPVVTWAVMRSSWKTPDRIFTASGSARWVTNLLWPGRRLSSQGWMSASVRAMPGGQPSTTQPMAGPWLSPKVVTRKRWPNVLWDMDSLMVAPEALALLAFPVALLFWSRREAPRSARGSRSLLGCLPHGTRIGNRAACAGQLCDLGALNPEDHALRLIQGRHARGIQAQEQASQDPGGGAMADGEGVGFQAVHPGDQAGGHVLVIFTAQRRHVPFVGGAAVVISGVKGARLGLGQLVPLSQIDFLNTGIGGVALGRQLQHAARNLHGGAGTFQRRGDTGNDGLDPQLASQDLADLMRLFPAQRRERRVLLAGEAFFEIGAGLAVAREIERQPIGELKRLHPASAPRRYRARLRPSCPQCDSPHPHADSRPSPQRPGPTAGTRRSCPLRLGSRCGAGENYIRSISGYSGCRQCRRRPGS